MFVLKILQSKMGPEYDTQKRTVKPCEDKIDKFLNVAIFRSWFPKDCNRCLFLFRWASYLTDYYPDKCGRIEFAKSTNLPIGCIMVPIIKYIRRRYQNI